MYVGYTVYPYSLFMEKRGGKYHDSSGSSTSSDNDIRFFFYQNPHCLKKHQNKFVTISPTEIADFIQLLSTNRRSLIIVRSDIT